MRMLLLISTMTAVAGVFYAHTPIVAGEPQIVPVETRADRHAWPILKRYDQDHLVRIALPLGGIGTGTVSLGGRGDLRDWEIMNRPAKGFSRSGVRAARFLPFMLRQPTARQ